MQKILQVTPFKFLAERSLVSQLNANPNAARAAFRSARTIATYVGYDVLNSLLINGILFQRTEAKHVALSVLAQCYPAKFTD